MPKTLPTETAPSATPAPVIPRSGTIMIPEDSNRIVRAFCQRHPGLSKSDVIRAALNRFLPDLESGKALIANGSLVYREELTPAGHN